MSEEKLDLSKLTKKTTTEQKKISEPPVLKEEQEFACYNCTRNSTIVITPKGKRLAFSAHKFITADDEAIAYLDKQIANKSLPGITRGDNVTTSDMDPMQAMRKKFYEEFQAEQAEAARKAALGEIPDMGSTLPENVAPKKVLTSDGVAN